MAGVSSDGLKTAVLPSSRLGPSIHSGTAKGKFHGVMTATTPHGLRRMKASFSAISEATHVADRHAAGAEDVLDHVQAFDDLGPALGDDLAALAGHQLGQVVGVALDELGEVVEQFGPADAALAPPERDRRPARRRRPGGLLRRELAGKRPTTSSAWAGLRLSKAVAVGGPPLAGDEVAAGEDRGGHGRVLPGGRRTRAPLDASAKERRRRRRSAEWDGQGDYSPRPRAATTNTGRGGQTGTRTSARAWRPPVDPRQIAPIFPSLPASVVPY